MVISTLRPFRCGYCLRWWPTVDVLNRHREGHKMIHSRKTPWVKSYTSHHGTKMHRRKPPHRIQISECVRSYKSSVCKKECTDEKHEKINLDVNRDVWATKTTKEQSMECNQKVTVPSSYECQKTETGGMESSEITSNVEQFECPVCKKVFPDNIQRDKHHINSHPVKYHVYIKYSRRPNKFGCSWCKEYFRTYQDLNSHETCIHKCIPDMTSFACEYCEKSFHSKLDLREHVKEHKLHVCEICGKSWSTRSALAKHKKRYELHRDKHHSKINIQLDKHRNSHSVNHNSQRARYGCSWCKEFFHTPKDLTSHEKGIHKCLPGMTTFACKYCKQSFCSKLDLREHVKEHKLHSCEICGKSWSTRSLLAKHKRCHRQYTENKKQETSNGNMSSTPDNLTNQSIDVSKIYLDKNGDVVCATKKTMEQSTECNQKVTVPSSNEYRKTGTGGIHLDKKGDVVCATKKTMEQSTECTANSVRARYGCSWCKEYFHTPKELTSHEKSIHKCIPGMTSFACEYCEKSFCSKLDLREHVKKHKLHLCEICGKPWSTRTLLAKHKRCHYNLYSCEICGISWSSKGALAKHKRCHKPNLSSLKSKKEFLGKQKRPTVHADCPTLTFKCDNCGEKYNQKSELEAHRRREHWNQLPYSCNQCSKSFGKKVYLKRHVIRKHTPGGRDKLDKKKFLCSVCGKQFSRLAKLNTHTDWFHLGKRQQQKDGPSQDLPSPISSLCPYCGKTFAENKLLNKHIAHAHIAPKSKISNLCPYCGKTFTENKLLNSHIAHVHTAPESKIHKCTECEKSFTIKSRLNRHLRVHTTTVKSYACDVCGKSFLQNDYLKKHMKWHSPELPYSCSFCDKKFPFLFAVQSHEKTHRGVCNYACTKCDASFVHSNSLTWHMKSKHANGAS